MGEGLKRAFADAKATRKPAATVWCVVDDMGIILNWTLSRTEQSALDAFGKLIPRGYTVQQFKLVPVRKRGKKS